MSDSRGPDGARSSDPVTAGAPDLVDRQQRTERLLLQGLDFYLAGHYEQAINVWTRVLFLDRGHARARAYIERARSAIAERQRESDELVDSGMAAFERGEVSTAGRLLRSAVDRGGHQHDTLAFLERVERLEAAGRQRRLTSRLTGRSRAARDGETVAPGTGIRLAPLVTLLLLAGAAVYLGATWREIGWPLAIRPPARPAAMPAIEEPLPVPSGSDLAIGRARTLVRRGHLHEALAVLDQVPAAAPDRREVDRLRAAIQRALLTGADARTIETVTTPGSADAHEVSEVPLPQFR